MKREEIARYMAELIERDTARSVYYYSDCDADGHPILEPYCPCCGYDFGGITSKFCPDCVQRLLFEEVSE